MESIDGDFYQITVFPVNSPGTVMARANEGQF
jgi:hypothetical protein